MPYSFPAEENSSEGESATFTVGRRRRPSGTSAATTTMAVPSSSPTAAATSKQRGNVSLERGLGRLASVRNLRRGGSVENLMKDGSPRRESKPKKKTLKYGFSLKAREYIAVGLFDHAIVLSQKANDVVGWSVALMLSNDAEKAVDVMEAFIIAACLVTYQEIHKEIGGVKFDYRQVLASIISAPGSTATVDIMQSLPPPTPQLYKDTILEVCETADWDELHQWYLTGVLLHPSYAPPTNPWLKQFFSIYATQDSTGRKRRHSGGGAHRVAPSNKTLTRLDVESILISQCTDSEIHQVNAIVSWKLSRYRTAMRSATEVLKSEPDDIQMRFLRCWCALMLGERHIVGEDSSQLMQSASLLVSTVGCALATFGIPLQSAKAAVEQFRSNDEEQNYVFALCEWCHATTLLQLGDFEQAKAIVEHTLPVASHRSLSIPLMDIFTTCCIALEDSTSLLQRRELLTPYQQLHLALVPRFGGGYQNDSINQVAIESDVGELLNPLNINSYSDVRQMMAMHTTTARSLFSFSHLREAWVEVSSAVGCAEEVVGSAVFALSDCAPHRVIFLGCTVGMTLLDKLIDEDEEASKQLSEEELKAKRDVDDKLGDQIIATCRGWARMIRDFHPKQVLGHAAITQVSIASHDLDSMERAVAMAEHFPTSIMTQNALSFALYSKHLIPDAIANAQKTLQRFPHVPEVATMYFAVSGNEGTYTYLYRGLLPFAYGPGMLDNTTGRLWFAFFITLLNFVIMIGMVICNLSEWIPLPYDAQSTVVRVQVPSMIGFFIAAGFFVYSILATFIQPTLVSILLTDLRVRNTRLNRFLYSSRGIPWVNVGNAVQISVLGNNFGFSSYWYTVLLYFLLALLQFPYSSRTFFLRSIDEPRMGLPFWITLIATDFTVFIIQAPLLFLATIIEPFMFLIFFFALPSLPPTYDTGDILQRLLIHEQAKKRDCADRFSLSSESNFIHIRLMKFLFAKTHSDMETFFFGNQEQEEDDLAVFPLIEVLDTITDEPLPVPKHYVPLDNDMKKLLESQRKKELVTVGEAKLGEGNLAGILESDTHPLGGDVLHDADLDELALEGSMHSDSSFGAEIMDALNAEFAKLSAQNATLKQAQTVSNTVKYGGEPTASGTAVAAPVRKLGDVGLYRENKERTDMLTTGPMMRQMHAKARRASEAPPPVTFGDDRPAIAPAAGAAATSPQAAAGAANAARPAFTGISTATSNTALLKAGMNRKRSIFHRPTVVEDFSIEDDLSTKESSKLGTQKKSDANKSKEDKGSIFGTKRGSFGLALEGDSDISSSSDDEEGVVAAKAPSKAPPSKQATVSPPKTTVVSPQPSKQSSGSSGPSKVGSVLGLGIHTVNSVSEMSFSSSDEDDAKATSQPVKPKKDESTTATVPPNAKKTNANDDPSVAGKRNRGAVSFVGGRESSSDPSRSVEESRGGWSEVYEKIAKENVSVPIAVGPTAAAAASVPTPTPSEALPPHPNQHRLSLAQAGLASAYAVQLQRKQSALLQQRSNLLEATSHQHISPPASETTSLSSAATGGDSNNTKRRMSVKDMVSMASTPKPTDTSAETRPLPTTVQRRQSTVRIGSEFDSTGANEGRPSSTNPISQESPKRISSAPGSRQDLQALDAEDEIKPVNGNLKVKKCLEELRYARSTFQDSLNSAKGIDEGTIAFLRKQLEQAKLKFVSDIQKIGPRISVDAFEAKKQLAELFVELVKEGDQQRGGNPEILMCLLNSITTVDFASTIVSRDLIRNAMENGQSIVLKVLLMHKPILTNLTSDQMSSYLVSCQVSTCERRCSILMTLLEVATRSRNCCAAATQMQVLWQETMEKIISLQQTLPNEDRSDVCNLLDVALNHPFLDLDVDQEGRDKQTLFSRACREGDLVVVQHLLSRNKVKEINRINSDGSNPLQQAVLKNNLAVVELLLKQRGIQESLVHNFPKGNVLEIAKSLKKDQRIIDLLAKAMPEKPKTVPGASDDTLEASAAIKLLLVPLKSLLEDLEVALRNEMATKEEIQRLQASVYAAKENASQRMESMGPGKQLSVNKEVKEMVLSLTDTLTRDGERKEGNLKLVRVIVQKLDQCLQVAPTALQRFWPYRCAENGSMDLLKVFLSLPSWKDAIHSKNGIATREMIESAAKSPQTRISMLGLLLEHHRVLMLEEYKDIVMPTWQRVVTDICAQPVIRLSKEQQTRRTQLIDKILSLKFIAIDFETEQHRSDHHTIFSRLCADGDAELLRVLLSYGVIKNPNRCQSDGHCALTSAIVAGQVEVIEVLTAPMWRLSINVNIQTADGRPLEIARKQKVDGQIVERLLQCGAT